MSSWLFEILGQKDQSKSSYAVQTSFNSNCLRWYLSWNKTAALADFTNKFRQRVGTKIDLMTNFVQRRGHRKEVTHSLLNCIGKRRCLCVLSPTIERENITSQDISKQSKALWWSQRAKLLSVFLLTDLCCNAECEKEKHGDLKTHLSFACDLCAIWPCMKIRRSFKNDISLFNSANQ